MSSPNHEASAHSSLISFRLAFILIYFDHVSSLEFALHTFEDMDMAFYRISRFSASYKRRSLLTAAPQTGKGRVGRCWWYPDPKQASAILWIENYCHPPSSGMFRRPILMLRPRPCTDSKQRTHSHQCKWTPLGALCQEKTWCKNMGATEFLRCLPSASSLVSPPFAQHQPNFTRGSDQSGWRKGGTGKKY
jgi:hypothetical protein